MRSFYIYIFIILLTTNPLYLQGQQPKREFRGVWIATINNLDWPSNPKSTTELKKNELTSILNRLDSLNFNAVIFQIRPAADAFYISSTEPCSVYLSGSQGKCPENGWDPLKFMIEECHKRGMELHAWMNPFRVQQNPKDTLSENNIAVKHPNWIVSYGSKIYLDPGIPGVRDYLIDVVSEVVKKYDIDAVHFDDYFYPYPVENLPFPDTLSFNLYNRGFKSSEINDWRRDNVDLIIQSINSSIKRIKPDIKFGVSPFGVWQNFMDDNSGSVTKTGISNFNHLYADVIKWLVNGWIDYLIPQIYWEIGNPAADFVTLANWWNDHSYSRHIYIGHALYKLTEENSPAWSNEREIPEQIHIARKLDDIYGSSFFRMRYLYMNPQNFTKILEKEIYPEKALLPEMKWLDSIPPVSPKRLTPYGFFRINKLKIKYKKKQIPSSDLLGYLIYSSEKQNSLDINNPSNILQFTDKNEIIINKLNLPSKKSFYIWVTAIDKHHNESEPVGKIKIRKK